MINIHLPTSLVGWLENPKNSSVLGNSLRQLKEEVETNRAALAQLERRVQRMRVGTWREEGFHHKLGIFYDILEETKVEYPVSCFFLK